MTGVATYCQIPHGNFSTKFGYWVYIPRYLPYGGKIFGLYYIYVVMLDNPHFVSKIHSVHRKSIGKKSTVFKFIQKTIGKTTFVSKIHLNYIKNWKIVIMCPKCIKIIKNLLEKPYLCVQNPSKSHQKFIKKAFPSQNPSFM